MTVCFASMESYHGCVDSCRHAAVVLGGRAAAIPDQAGATRDFGDAEIVILSSWHPAYEPFLIDRRAAVVPRWHSTILQVELAGEAWKLARLVNLLDRGAIPALAVNDPALASVLGRDGVVYLPEVLDLREHASVVPMRLRGTNVSLFGAPHPRKNLFVQSAAFEQVRRSRGDAEWTLHLSGQSLFQQGALEWLEISRVPFVDHGWLGRAEYLTLAAAMDAALCSSLCDSYCYVAADHAALGVPVVAAPGITCLSHGDARSQLRCDDVHEVAESLDRALANRREIARGQRQVLEARAAENASVARAALAEIESRTRRWHDRRRGTATEPKP